MHIFKGIYYKRGAVLAVHSFNPGINIPAFFEIPYDIYIKHVA